jgi:flagellar biogenesis protein FliO
MAGGAATIKLLQEEQAPIATEASAAKSSSSAGWVRLFLALFVFSLAGGGAYVAAKFLKKQGAFRGSRKYLVENLAYCPVGPGGKTGVGLIKVGSEFVLVGVTGQQVSFLSNLPKLSAQYESENHFERDTFRAAVEEEVQRLKTKGELTV